MKRISPYRTAVERLAGTLYEALPDRLVDCAGQLHPLLAMMTGLRQSVTEISGQTRIGDLPATVIAAGSGPGVEYILGRFFGGISRRRPIGHVPLYRLPRLLERLRSDAHLTVVRVDRLSSRLLFSDDYIAVPEWIGGWMAVPADPDRHSRRNKSLKNDRRKALASGISCRITRDDAAFEAFYHTMYVPFSENRYGEEGVVANIHQLRRVFRHGGLVLAEREETPLAAALFARQGSLFKLVVLGTRMGEWAPVKLGVFWAIYAFCLRHAGRIGCRTIDFGASRANLYDGVLRYKRKWGVALGEKWNARHYFLFYWNALDDRLLNFFQQNPLIFEKNERLWGLMSPFGAAGEAPGSDTVNMARHAWMPGLQGLYVLCQPNGRRIFPPGIIPIDPGEGGGLSPKKLSRRIG